MSAYPGLADCAEKKALLSEVSSLRGLKVRNRMSPRRSTTKQSNTPGGNITSPSPSKRHRPRTPKEGKEDKSPSAPSSLTKRLKTSSSPLRERPTKKGWMKNRSPLKQLSAVVTSPAATAASKKLRCMGSIAVGDAEASASVVGDAAAAVAAAENDELFSRLQDLEEENSDLKRRNRSLEERCTELLRENAAMSIRLEKAEEASKETRKSGQEDERRRECERKERLGRQNPLNPVLVEHMERVDRTLGDGPGGLKTSVVGRGHFPVSVPKREEWTCSSYYAHQDKVGSKNVLQAMGEALQAKVQKVASSDDNGKVSGAIEGVEADKENARELCNEMQKVADFWF